MSKKYKVDVWFPPVRNFPLGAENNIREITRELVCSDDEKRAFAKEGNQLILFEIAEKKANPPGVDFECVYVDTASTEREAYEFLESRLKKNVPGPAEHYTAAHCALIESPSTT